MGKLRRLGIICLLGAATAPASAAPVPITALAFSPDGAALISNGPGVLEVRSPVDGTLRRRIECDLPKVTALSFSPAGELLAVAGGTPAVNGVVQILDWRRERRLVTLTNHSDLCTAVSFSRNGSRLAVAGSDHVTRVWQVEDRSLRELFVLEGHAGPVLAATFSSEDALVVTASADRSVKVWSAADGTLLRTFNNHTEPVQALAARPQLGEEELSVCATGGSDRTVRIWQPGIGRMVRIIRGHGGAVFALAYHPDGRTLFSAGEEGIIRRLDSNSDAILEAWPTHDDWIYALAVSPDGRRLASGDWQGQVRVRELGEGGKN